MGKLVFLSILYDFYLVTLTFDPLIASKFITWIMCCKILMPFLFSVNPSITQLCHLFLALAHVLQTEVRALISSPLGLVVIVI